NSTNLQLRVETSGALNTTQSLALSVSPNQFVTNTFTIALTGALQTGVPLTVRVRAFDSAGNSNVITRSFALSDNKSPQLLSVFPTNGAVRQSLWLSAMSFNFDEAIAANT